MENDKKNKFKHFYVFSYTTERTKIETMNETKKRAQGFGRCMAMQCVVKGNKFSLDHCQELTFRNVLV